MDDHRDAQVTGRVTTHPAHDGTLVTDLVTRASAGDQQAWDALVERYAPLVWSICGRYRQCHRARHSWHEYGISKAWLPNLLAQSALGVRQRR